MALPTSLKPCTILSSNGFKKLNTTEPLEAIQKELTHPYLINSAKEIYDNYMME